MAKFKFRLQGLLNVKEKIEDRKRQEYGLAVAQVEREKQKKQDILDKKEAMIVEFRQCIDKIIKAGSHDSYNNFIEFLKEEVTRQEKVILEAQKKVEMKRQELVDAMRERKTLEKLSERQYEEFLLGQKLAEQKIVDEIVSYRSNRV